MNQPLTTEDLAEAAKCIRLWSESDTCDDRPENLAYLRALADKLTTAACSFGVHDQCLKNDVLPNTLCQCNCHDK